MIDLPKNAARHVEAAQLAAKRQDASTHLRELRAAARAAPQHPAVLNMLALRLLTDGDFDQASALLERATRADPRAPELFLNLAKARQVAKDRKGEKNAIEAALAIDQRHFAGRIRRAEWYEGSGDAASAAADWSAVLQLSASFTAGQMRQVEPFLVRARSAVSAWTAQITTALDTNLASARAVATADERRRFETCVDTALGRRRIYAPEPFGLHFPFLPADEFFAREALPFLPALERHTEAVAMEIASLVDEGGGGFAPYVANPPGTPADKWSELDHSTRWSALYLHRDGIADEAALARFPATAEAIRGLPFNDIPGRGPTVFFSLLEAGTRIPPHTGVTNTRAIIHLPLIVPDGCGFRVGGETRPWRVGEAFGFDDTIEHEAWNESGEPRVVLILDVWNPHLTVVEQDLLRDYYRAAQASGLVPQDPVAR